MKTLYEDLSEGELKVHLHADPRETEGALRFCKDNVSDAALLLFQLHMRGRNLCLAAAPDVLIECPPDDEGMTFLVSAPLYPEIRLGSYKGLTVPWRAEREEQENTILSAATGGMQLDLPEALVRKKQSSIQAMERAYIAQEPYYILLTDVLTILEHSCRALGVSRPPEATLMNAADVMVAFMGQDDQSMDSFRSLLRENLLQLCEVPPAFDDEFDRIVEKRRKYVQGQTSEEHADEMFQTYLRSRGISRKVWEQETLDQAEELIRQDFLLNAVIEAEDLHLSAEEYVAGLKGHPEMAEEELRWLLLREKARKLIIDSAVIVK